MELSEDQIAFIQRDIADRGIQMDELAESLLDHICCVIECDTGSNFNEAYARALAGFGEQGLGRVQQETLLLLTLKRQLAMKRTMYLIGYIAAFLSTTGLLFKIQHWPGAAVMLTLGIALLNFGFLPMYFYNRYKKAAA